MQDKKSMSQETLDNLLLPSDSKKTTVSSSTGGADPLNLKPAPGGDSPPHLGMNSTGGKSEYSS